jgi:mRNA deadenylase 3'-5' endonuclease subunit Ccr4
MMSSARFCGIRLIIISFVGYQNASEELKLDIMTFNRRTDNLVGSIKRCSNRKKFVTSKINFYDADVAGLQDVAYSSINKYFT